MVASKWEIDFKDLEVLEKKLALIPEKSAKTINDVIHGKGIELTEMSVRNHIPVSSWDGGIRSKQHARNVNFPTIATKQNLGFVIRPKPKFRYLVFPDLAVGQSRNNVPVEFMAGGLETASPHIVGNMNRALDEVITRTLGG